MTKKSQQRRELWESRQTKNLCCYCGVDRPLPETKHCQKCLDKKHQVNLAYTKKHRQKITGYYRKLRQEVLCLYGALCVCCGESDTRFLSIDHTNNDGFLDRKNNPMSNSSFYLKLRREPLRGDLQILCYNCNLGKAFNGGICPHKQQ